jgi:hypothetical protein
MFVSHVWRVTDEISAGAHVNDFTAHGYNAFGVFGTIFRQLEWKANFFL